jgi:signal transduction histidine kinase
MGIADYAPDGITQLWSGESVEMASSPWMPLRSEGEVLLDQKEGQTAIRLHLPDHSIPDPVLVLANVGADRVEVLQGQTLLYEFGTLGPGFALPRAANAVHWIPLSPGMSLAPLEMVFQGSSFPDPVSGRPMVLVGSSHPIMLRLQRIAAGPVALALLFVFVGVYAGIAWIVRRHYGVRFSPWFAALSFLLGTALLLSRTMEFLSPEVASRFYYPGLLCFLLFPVALWKFMEEALGKGRWSLIRRCWQLQVMVCLVLWVPDLLGLTRFSSGSQLLGNGVLFLQLGVGTIVGVRFLRSSQVSQRWTARGILLFSLAGIMDIAHAVLIGTPEFEVYPLGALGLVVMLAYNQERAAGEAQRKLREQAVDLERHRDQLEETVEARTAELKKATQRAEAASKAKSEFLAHMSHEIRTPLHAILGHAQLLRTDVPTPSPVRERGEIIYRSGDHLLTLINDILDLSRIEAGGVDIVSESFHLPGVLEMVIEMLRPQAERKGLRFESCGTSALPEQVQGDKRRLRQILLNLLGNAIKFTEEGAVSLKVTHQQEELRLMISDSGPGMNPDEVDRWFEPFERGGDSAGKEGTGLGLSITRRLVDALNGEMTVRNRPEGGCLFEVRLPCPRCSACSVKLESQSTEIKEKIARPAGTIPEDFTALLQALRIGDLDRIEKEVTDLNDNHPELHEYCNALVQAARECDLGRLQRLLEDPKTGA